MERYREEHGSVFEFDTEANAYVFCGRLNGETLDEFIVNYEFIIDYEDDDPDTMQITSADLAEWVSSAAGVYTGN